MEETRGDSGEGEDEADDDDNEEEEEEEEEGWLFGRRAKKRT